MAELKGKKRKQPSSCPEGWLPDARAAGRHLSDPYLRLRRHGTGWRRCWTVSLRRALRSGAAELFAEVAAGRTAASLKSTYLERYGMLARMFNAVRVSLEGKVSAVRAAQRFRVDGLERRIARAERQVAKAEE